MILLSVLTKDLWKKNIASAAFWDSKEYNQTTQDIFFKSSEKIT